MRLVRLLALAGALLACPPAHAGITTYSAAGPDAVSLAAEVNEFRAALGTLNANTAGTVSTGRREINWDGVPDNFAAPNPLPRDFFNATSPRGVLLSTLGATEEFFVSADASNPSNTPAEFMNIAGTYGAEFEPFSPSRMFIAGTTTLTDVQFLVPGTNQPATVAGFGVVFSDIDSLGSTRVRMYAHDGSSIGSLQVSSANKGLSFIGATFTAGERIARVRIQAGNAHLDGTNDGGNELDKVVMDDFIFGEPGLPRVSVSDVTVNEAAGSATVTVTRDVATTVPTRVSYATAPDGADDGQDYTGTSGVIDFASGETSRDIVVPVVNDAGDEPDEAVKVALTGGDITFADAEGRVVITDDDPAPVPTPAPTPSPAPAAAPDAKPPVIRVTGVRTKGCVRKDFTVRVTVTDDNPVAARVRLDRRTLADAAKLNGPLRASVPARGLRRGRHSLRVNATGLDGRKASKTVRFRRC